MSVTPQILNEAMLAYMPLRNREKLAEHIAKNGLEGQNQEIVSELDAVLKTAQDYLWEYPGGVPWTDEFEYRYRDFLVQRHPWLDSASVARVFAFSRWICWHEGLNAKDER